MPRKENTQDGAGDRVDRQEPAGTHQEMAPGMAALLQAMQQQATQQQQHHEEQQRRYDEQQQRHEEQLALQRQHEAELMQMMARFFSARGCTQSSLLPEPHQQYGPRREASNEGGPGKQVGGGALVQEGTARGNEDTSPAEVHVEGMGTGTGRERRDAKRTAQGWKGPVNKDRLEEGPPALRDNLDILRRHPGPPKYQTQRTEVGAQQGHARLAEYGPTQGSRVTYQDGRKWACEATQSYGLGKNLKEEDDGKTGVAGVEASMPAVSLRTRDLEPHAITSACELDTEEKPPSKDQKTGTAKSPERPEPKADVAGHIAVTVTYEMDAESTQLGGEVRPRPDQGDEAEEMGGGTAPGGNNEATPTCMRPNTAPKPGEQMTTGDTDSDAGDGGSEGEEPLLQGELWQRNTSELSDEPMQVSSSEGATPVNDVGTTSPEDEERREQGAALDEHEPTQLLGNEINNATDAADPEEAADAYASDDATDTVGADDAIEAAGPDDTADAATADDAAGVLGAHDAMLTGDPGEATVSVDVRDVTVTVGDAGGAKFQAGSVNDHLAMVTGCSQTDDVTQAVINPETVSARPDDAGDDGATQATSELETKVAPTRLPAEGGRSDATTGYGMERRNRDEVKVTHDTDAIHDDILDENTDMASQDEGLHFIPEGASTPIHEVDLLVFQSLVAKNDVQSFASAGVDGGGSPRRAEPLEPLVTTATTEGVPSLLPSNGELCRENYRPIDGEGMGEAQEAVVPPGGGTETRTRACDMRIGDVDVGSRGGCADDVTREGDETLPPETGAADVMKQMSGAIQDEMAVVFGKICGKGKGLADEEPDAMGSSQPDAATANEEPIQAYGLGDDLGVPQLPVAVSVLDDVDLTPAVVPATASTCQVGRLTGEDQGMDQGSEPPVGEGADQRHGMPPVERGRQPRAMAHRAQAAEVSTMARWLRISAASSHGVGPPIAQKPARKTMTVPGCRFGHADAEAMTTLDSKSRKSGCAEPDVVRAAGREGQRSRRDEAEAVTTAGQQRGRRVEPIKRQDGSRTEGETSGDVRPRCSQRAVPSKGKLTVSSAIGGDRRENGNEVLALEGGAGVTRPGQSQGGMQQPRKTLPSPSPSSPRRSQRTRNRATDKDLDTTEPPSTCKKAASTRQKMLAPGRSTIGRPVTVEDGCTPQRGWTASGGCRGPPGCAGASRPTHTAGPRMRSGRATRSPRQYDREY